MPLFHISKEAKKLVGLLADYYEAGDCQCAAMAERVHDHETPMNPVCVRCKIGEQLSETLESVFNELRNELNL